MTYPLAKVGDTWIASDTTMRDAIGSADNAKVGERCYVVGDAEYKLDTVDGANASSWSSLGGTPPGTSGQKQFQTSLAAISAKSVPAPLAFWDFAGRLTELVTGGSGWDLVYDPNTTAVGSWSLVDGQPGVAGETWAHWFPAENGLRTDAENGSLLLTESMSVALWVKVVGRAATLHNDEQVLLSLAHQSSSTLGTDTSPCYQLGFFDNRNNTSQGSRQLYYTHWDATPTRHTAVATKNSLPASIDVGSWVHVGFVRTKNGDADYTVQLFVNGKPFGPSTNILANPNPATQTNMRLHVGSGRNNNDRIESFMRDLGIWNVALSDAQMLALYEIGIGV